MIRVFGPFPAGSEVLSTLTQWPWTALRTGAVVSAVAFLDVFVRGHNNLAVHGVADEVGHLITGLMFATVLMMSGVPLSLPWALIGSVAIDIDHLPWLVNWINQPDHLSRSVTHSFATVLVIAGIGLADRKRWMIWYSLAVGTLVHLLRDLATGNVRLWWPLSDDIHLISYYGYSFSLGVAGAIIIAGSILYPERIPSLQFERIWSLLSRLNLKSGPGKDA